jgi:NADPH:quinone reductase-like Zn-dependent oxidoreductase
MRSLILKAPGGLENLTFVERDVPRPKPGELLVRIHASSLNFHDYVVAMGIKPVDDGRILMSDAGGEVVAVGDGVFGFAVGDRVVSVFYREWQTGDIATDVQANTIPGDTCDGYGSDYVTAPEAWFTKAPAGWSHAEAATLTCAGLTAWRGLVAEGKPKPGDTVLIQGTGGVSIFALQFAKAAGAAVIATSSSGEKLERLRALGADHVINYRETPDWGTKAREITGGRGVDHVVEIGGSGTLAQSIRACARGGHIALIGVLAGMGGEIPAHEIFLSQIRISGVLVGSRADQLEMIRALDVNGIRPVIDSAFAIDALSDAYCHQASGKHFGKICVTL